MRPVATLTTPQPLGPAVDGFAIREVRILIPPDAPAGLTLRWQPTAGGRAIGPEESMALAQDEMGDTAVLDAALLAYLQDVLRAKGRGVARVEQAVEPLKTQPKAVDTPLVGLR